MREEIRDLLAPYETETDAQSPGVYLRQLYHSEKQLASPCETNMRESSEGNQLRQLCEQESNELRGADGGDDSGQPTMMSFKAFLGSQDDTITDEEAIKKYAEYKLEFKRQQLNEFFVSHKDEEW